LTGNQHEILNSVTFNARLIFFKGEVAMRNYFKILVLIMVLALSGCGSGATSGDPLGTDTISTLIASPTSLGLGESSVITATVLHADGKAATGRSVSFSFVSNNTGGALIVNDDGKNNGIATATYTTGTNTPVLSLQDTVQARIENGATAVVVLTRAAVAGGGGAGGRQISLTGSPTSLAAGQNSILTAKVTDTTGNPVTGQVVTFQFLGGVAAPSGATIVTLNGGTTDASGQALAIYMAGAASPNTTVEDTVQASTTGSTAAVIITRTASTAIPPAGYRVALTADVTSLAAGQSAIVTATVTDGSGNSASGQAVTFALLKNNSGAALVPLNVGGNTDSSGRAVAVYTAGVTTPASSLQDTIQASITGSTGAIVMTRTAAGGGVGTGVRMTVTATPTSVIAGAMSVIVAQVNNADGTAAAGQSVTFGFVTNNSGAPALATVNATTDSSGTAIATYTAGSNSPGLSIQDAVSASVTGSAGAAIITRLAATGTGNRIALTLTPSIPLATTTSNCIVTATVRRDDGVTPVANETVTFSIITGGGTIAPLTVTTNNSGIANAIFTAPGTPTGNEAVVRAQILGTTNGGDAVGIIYW
jgi:protocatechuate 3,4-dioxygenase beta subunit